MTIELKIPEVGESITEVQISEWLKTPGDPVTADEPVAIIDSEKTTFELRAPKNGTLTTILHQVGETVEVGEVIARIDSDGQITHEKPPESKVATRQETTAPAALEPSTQTRHARIPPQGQLETEQETRQPDATKPPADGEDGSRRLPAETGSNGKTTQTIDRAAAAVDQAQPRSPQTSPRLTPATDREEEVVPMTRLRRTIARRLVQAHQTMAALTTFNELDMSAVQDLRRELGEPFEKRYSVKLGLMSFFVKAAVDALKQFPMLNAEIRDTDIIYRNYFDIGVAIATERGLVVPVLRHAHCMSFAELERAIGDFAQNARDGNLKPDDLEGGTFTITNGGVFGSLFSTPIINPPQSGILGIHTIQERPVVLQGRVVIRPMMYLALTYDHRLVDGREAVLFLRRVKEGIESPARLLLEV